MMPELRHSSDARTLRDPPPPKTRSTRPAGYRPTSRRETDEGGVRRSATAAGRLLGRAGQREPGSKTTRRSHRRMTASDLCRRSAHEDDSASARRAPRSGARSPRRHSPSALESVAGSGREAAALLGRALPLRVRPARPRVTSPPHLAKEPGTFYDFLTSSSYSTSARATLRSSWLAKGRELSCNSAVQTCTLRPRFDAAVGYAVSAPLSEVVHVAEDAACATTFRSLGSAAVALRRRRERRHVAVISGNLRGPRPRTYVSLASCSSV